MTLFFRKIAFWEGISLLLLLFIAMPLKYIWNEPILVRIVGMAHGVLFLAYIGFAFWLFFKEKWNLSKLFIVLIASLIPFGTFYIDRKYLRK